MRTRRSSSLRVSMMWAVWMAVGVMRLIVGTKYDSIANVYETRQLSMDSTLHWLSMKSRGRIRHHQMR